jgi:ribosome-associated toxin RatA of RatAB toxin-antitoxin module
VHNKKRADTGSDYHLLSNFKVKFQAPKKKFETRNKVTDVSKLENKQIKRKISVGSTE